MTRPDSFLRVGPIRWAWIVRDTRSSPAGPRPNPCEAVIDRTESIRYTSHGRRSAHHLIQQGYVYKPTTSRPNDSWNPDEESRSAYWQRLKQDLSRRLDTIAARHRLRQRLQRYRHRPTFPRNQQIYRAHLGGESGRALARRFNLPPGRIRGIVRVARSYAQQAEQLDPRPRGRSSLGSSRLFDQVDARLHPSTMMLRDP